MKHMWITPMSNKAKYEKTKIVEVWRGLSMRSSCDEQEAQPVLRWVIFARGE